MGRRAAALARMGRYREAKRVVRSAVALWDHPWLHHQLGMLLLRSVDFEEAIQELEHAAYSWRPDAMFEREWPVYWRDLSCAYREAGRVDDAASALACAHFLNMPSPTYATLLLQLGQVCKDMGAFGCEIQCHATAARTMILAGVSPAREGPSLRTIAQSAARAYRNEGWTASAALADQRARAGLSARRSRVYLRHLRRELGEQDARG